MNSTTLAERKRAQKEALFFRELSNLFLRISLDDKEMVDFTLNRVALSKDKSSITVYFYADGGSKRFEEKKDALIMYKPSLRKALSQLISSRYTPELIFKYDHLFEKQLRLNNLLLELEEDES